MAKTKAPTPQELYRQKKEREEQERTAYLPPGLLNHGNTCFMNSVLQGLIATRLLSDLVHFNPIPSDIQRTAATPIVSRRSPQLTNGHKLARFYEQPWVNTMPVGDVFLSVMYKAWDSQSKRKRETLSPKPLLSALGQKYDQYLDFAQQDAHEFLRILLDAMRMEEQDVIKTRQPLRKKRRYLAKNDDENSLISLADMIFGGQLTSILVCQKCKHVSQTYEDFNDISLSIKAEDYYPHRKRDRFKKMVGKLTAFPGTSSKQAAPRLPISAVEILRSSSVPPSPRDVNNHEEPPIADGPRRKSLELETKTKGEESAPESPELPSLPPVTTRTTTENDSAQVVVSVSVPEEEKHVDFLQPMTKQGRQESGQNTIESGGEKDGSGRDSWAKIGRRISLSVGLVKPKATDKKDRERKSRSVDRNGLGGLIKEVVAEVDGGIQKSYSPSGGTSSHEEKSRVASDGFLHPPTTLHSLNTDDAIPISASMPHPKHSESNSSLVNNQSGSPQPTISSSTNFLSSHGSIFPVQRSKSPKPPKPTHAETEYLRRILADVAMSPSTNSPFSIFKPPLMHSHSSHHGARVAITSNLSNTASATSISEKAAWMGIGVRNLSGIEECLRMFTAVEVLDGENMVGCRRCWKIQHGELQTSRGKNEDSDQDDEDEDEGFPSKGDEKDTASDTIDPIATLTRQPMQRPPLQVVPPSLSLSGGTTIHIPSSISTPTVSFYSHDNEDSMSDARSVSSLPTEPTSPSLTSFETSKETGESTFSLAEKSSNLAPGSSATQSGPGGLPIPVISTTAPLENTTVLSSSPSLAPLSMPKEAHILEANRQSTYSRLVGSSAEPPATGSILSPHPRLTQALYGYNTSSGSKDSLVIPKIGRNNRIQSQSQKRISYSSSTTTDNDSSDDDTDTSVGTSVSGESFGSSRQNQISSTQSQIPQVNGSGSKSTIETSFGQDPPLSASTIVPPKSLQKKAPKPPKPTIMRPAYKRYLISIPPPVLVIHLKRFQQTSKTPLMSFSHGLKKLDDYISFPEYLDLTPFLAPRKEDYGLGKKGKDKDKEKKSQNKEERCMYRLYAVVMHIGNMLGGHYVAYTALPQHPPDSMDPNAANSISSDPPNPNTEGTEEKAHHTHPQSKHTERQWAYISDTMVRLTTLEEVLHSKAYICMYERC